MQQCLIFRFQKRAKKREIQEKRGGSQACKVWEAVGLDPGPLFPPFPKEKFLNMFVFRVLFRVLSGLE